MAFKPVINQECYPRTYKQELAEDIFRIYDRDNSGTVDFKVPV
jgi:Ca2+-binding EF-hand superfamily protein